MSLEGKGQNRYEDNWWKQDRNFLFKIQLYLLSIDYVPDTVPSAEHIAENKIDILPTFTKLIF